MILPYQLIKKKFNENDPLKLYSKNIYLNGEKFSIIKIPTHCHSKQGIKDDKYSISNLSQIFQKLSRKTDVLKFFFFLFHFFF